MKRIGIDVGGTFTDVVVLDEESGATSWFKAPTDYGQPSDGIMHAFEESGVPAGDVSHVKVGTTLGLNAILTRGGARTGLLTTRGFRDVLEIRRTHRKKLFDLYETVPEPLVPRDLRLEIDERVSSDGGVVTPLDEDGVRRAWAELRDKGVTALAIAYLFSFENPDHEMRTKEIVLEEGGADVVFTSTEVLPVFREYERTSTTVIAAYVAPAVRGYVSELAARLGAEGLRAGRLSVMTNSGGAMSADAAAEAPVPTLLSGPAGGVAAARWLGERVGIQNLLTLDMGGTSCDVSGVVDGVPDERLDMEIGGLDVAYPTFDIHTIGAGGGSVAWIDSGGALRIGPESAGGVPGPACYGRGGARPTVTDANLVLGRYDVAYPLGGSLQLDLEAAKVAIDTDIAAPLGLSMEEAAAGIVRLVNAHMANAVRTISVERGRDARQFALAAFGGGGPVHAVDIARELQIPTVLVPPFPGCTSAFGAALSVTRRDLLRSVGRPVDELVVDELAVMIADLTAELGETLAGEGYEADRVSVEVWLNFHYTGQAHDLAIRLDGVDLTPETLAAAAEEFHRLHDRLYGHSFDEIPIELVTVRVTGFGAPDDPTMWWDWRASSGPERHESRGVYFESIGDFVETEVCLRAELGLGSQTTGPVVVQSVDSTVLVPPGWRATAHETGTLIVERDEEQQ
ncbi:MAG: hydantoinase/oxoprolinase family protein [Acidimicrobiales bacterium]